MLFLLDEKLGYHKKPTELFVGFSQNFSRRCPQKCPGNQMEIETMVPELDSPSIGLGTIYRFGFDRVVCVRSRDLGTIERVPYRGLGVITIQSNSDVFLILTTILLCLHSVSLHLSVEIAMTEFCYGNLKNAREWEEAVILLVASSMETDINSSTYVRTSPLQTWFRKGDSTWKFSLWQIPLYRAQENYTRI